MPNKKVVKLELSKGALKKVCGTSLQGYVDVSYNQIKKVFGLPSSDGDDYKTDVEWYLNTPAGVATIYNYKDGRNYLGGIGTPKTKITEWHIGGKTEGVVSYIKEALLN